jgi:hypothetical protein
LFGYVKVGEKPEPVGSFRRCISRSFVLLTMVKLKTRRPKVAEFIGFHLEKRSLVSGPRMKAADKFTAVLYPSDEKINRIRDFSDSCSFELFGMNTASRSKICL